MPAPDAIPCGPWVDTVLRRARDAGAVGTSRADARLLLSAAHRLVIAKDGLLLAQATFQTTPRRCVYDVNELTDDNTQQPAQVLRIDDLQLDGRSLPQATWRSLVQMDRRWLRRLGEPPSLWAAFGQDHFIIYPASEAARTLVLRFVPRVADLATDDDTFAVREDRLPAVADWTEALLLLRSRQYDALAAVMRRLGFHQKAAADAA